MWKALNFGGVHLPRSLTHLTEACPHCGGGGQWSSEIYWGHQNDEVLSICSRTDDRRPDTGSTDILLSSHVKETASERRY